MPENDQTSVDAQWLSAAVTDMYDAYMAADRARADSYIAQDVTIWDTDHEPLVFGLSGLNELRDSRPAGSVEAVAGIDVTEPLVDIWGDMAVVRHTFTVRYVDPAAAPERVRNTAVWQRRDGRWLIVHNHEDVLPAPSTQHPLPEKEESQ